MSTENVTDGRATRRALAAGAVGAALAAGAFWLAGNASTEATAQSRGVQVSAQQLLINQRISQAAVRRSNDALSQLASVRSTEADVAARLPMWAVVDGNGLRIRQRGAVDSAKVGTGNYRVDFGRDLSACAFSATVHSNNATAHRGYIMAEAEAANTNRLIVRTFSEANQATAADRPFLVQVTC